jgi:large subunit ribosomal protein L6
MVCFYISNSKIFLIETQLHLKLGYSHPIILDIPEGVQVSIPAPQRIILQGIDFPRITQFAATIRKYRPPEPYNQKGVFVGEETIKKKEGKKR